MVADLTGLELAIPTASTNGDVPLLYDDVIGFRAMTGGIDGATITAPSHLANPVRLLGISMIAEEAAGFVVPSDLAAPTGSRRLLQTVTPSTTDEASVRAEIAALYRRMHGMTRDPASDDVTDAYTLWSAVHEASDTRTAWSAVVAALLQSPDTLFY